VIEALLQKIINATTAKYIAAGASAFLGEYATFVVFYKFLGLKVVIANILSFCVGLVISFSAQRSWTFRHKERAYTKKVGHQLRLFITLSLANLLISTYSIQFLSNQGLNPLFGKICIMIAIALWNFGIFNRSIFSKVHEHSQ
jgi:putative flippase GtrA